MNHQINDLHEFELHVFLFLVISKKLQAHILFLINQILLLKAGQNEQNIKKKTFL